MILGMSVAAFTKLHVIISLIGIASGFVIVWGLWTARRFAGWTALFLTTTTLTSATGFMFPLKQVGPPHVVGAISLAVLAVALYALYERRLAGRWRWIYVVAAVAALYLNAFVGVVQAFQKIPFFNALAPTRTELPFAIAQLLTLGIFVFSGILGVRQFRPA